MPTGDLAARFLLQNANPTAKVVIANRNRDTVTRIEHHMKPRGIEATFTDPTSSIAECAVSFARERGC